MAGSVFIFRKNEHNCHITEWFALVFCLANLR